MYRMAATTAPYSRPTSSEDSSAPGRGLMPGGAGQLSSGGGGQGRAVQVPSLRSRPGWPSAPGAVTWARSGRPAGGRRREDVRTPARPVVALSASSGPPWGCPSSRSSGRPTSRRPVSRCPGIQVSGRTSSGVRGAAATRSAPRRTLEWLGVAGRPRLGPTGRRAPWSRAAWSPAGLGPDGKGMVRRWPWLACTRSTVARAAAWPASRLRRRLGPGGPARALVQARVPAGGGEHGTEQVLTGRGRASWALSSA
jgi:hypothetical protein